MLGRREIFQSLTELEQLERLRSEDTLSPHDFPLYWVILDPKSKEDKVKITNLKNLQKIKILEFIKHNLFNKIYLRHTRHTFLSCVIRCANMKWFRQVVLEIQRGHHSGHRRTDGQGETTIPPFNFVEAGDMIKNILWFSFLLNRLIICYFTVCLMDNSSIT